MRPLRRNGRSSAGYTLMELVIAAMLSLLVIAGLYIVYAGHSRVFRGQEMVSQVQTSLRFAMAILTDDLQKAGSHAVADSQDQRDFNKLYRTPNVFGGRIMAVNLIQGAGSADPAMIAAHPIRPSQAPDDLILVGDFSDSAFRYWNEDKSGGNVFVLQNTTSTDQTDPFPTSVDDFNTIFDVPGADRPTALSVEYQNRIFISVLDGRDYATKRLTVADSTPAQPAGSWEGALVSTINKVRWSVRPPQLTPAEVALAPSRAELGNRYDLVREELDWNTNEPVNSLTVAENVVDFQVWFLFNDETNPDTGPSVQQWVGALAPPRDDFTGGNPCNAGALGDPGCEVNKVRAAIVRLSIRTHREDPNFLFPAGPVRPLNWYDADPNSAGAARVRTLTTQVALSSMEYLR